MQGFVFFVLTASLISRACPDDYEYAVHVRWQFNGFKSVITSRRIIKMETNGKNKSEPMNQD